MCEEVVSILQMTTLNQRFHRFMLATAGVESIDRLLLRCATKNGQRADYLASSRRVVVEVKSLEVNPDYKIQDFLDRLAQSGRLSNLGDTNLAQLLSELPDGQALYDEIRERVTKVLDDIVAKADHQTRDTRELFGLNDALGVVVVLNESASLLFPDISTIKLFDMLRKRRRDGSLRYPNNHVIVLISEAHVIEAGPGITMHNVSTVYSEAGNGVPFATTFVERLNRNWAAFNGAGYLQSSELWDHFTARRPIKQFTVVRSAQKPS
jgi:hypothetical protein